MICIDYQVFMFCASKVDGVENEESMWETFPKKLGNENVAFISKIVLYSCFKQF